MRNQVIFGDCLKVMARIAAGSVDMILTDLPYGTTQNKWDTPLDLPKMWAQYWRVLKPDGVIVLTAQTPFSEALGASQLKALRYKWTWIKSQGTGHLNANRQPLKNTEDILVFYKKQPTYNPQKSGTEVRTQRRNSPAVTESYRPFNTIPVSEYVGRMPVTTLEFKKETGMHPTQKPVPLFEYLIKTYTNEGQLVLDTCAGSGTTAIACIRTGREYILIENDGLYCDIIDMRIYEETNL